ncbi:MAG: hypothetical protein Q8L23_15950 [Caulobacter sp.]|nr:hypothetical protein [Caulobacter sp.]
MTAEVIARPGPDAVLGGVVLTPRPFAREDEVTIHAMPEGASVAQMLDALEASGSLDPRLRPWVRVTAGDEPLPAALWPTARPKAGVTLFVEVAPMGGSNALRTLMQIAIIAISTFVGGHVGGALGSILALSINIAGMALVNAIAPVKQPDPAKRDPRYSLDGASNAARPHEPVPIVLGTRRIFPSRCANWYTRVQDNVVYLRQMFQASVSWVDRASPRLGQTPLDTFDGVTIRWNTLPTDALALDMFDRVVAEDSLGLTIKADAGWVTRTAPLESDSLSLDVAFMAGLYKAKESSGNPESRTVEYEFRYGPVGGDPAAATAIPFGTAGVITYTDPPAGTRRSEAWRVGYEWTVTHGQYDVHVRRVTADAASVKISDLLTWVCLRSFIDEPAIRQADEVPWIELELKATDQLNGIPDDFNFIATSVVKEATSTGPGATWISSRRPADLYLAASYPPFSDLELDADERAFAALAAWRTVGEAQGWAVDIADNQEQSVADLLARIAAGGRARPGLDYGALSVVVDWEKAAPRLMFSPRNTKNFRGEILYPSEAHALRLRFPNAEKDYAEDTITVFALDPLDVPYDLDTATLYESVELRDLTDADRVEWEGWRLLAERALRAESFTFEQDMEQLTAVEGARALLSHHVALVGQVTGRVRERIVDPLDALRIGLVLDETVVMVLGRSYDMAWRPGPDAVVVEYGLETVVGTGEIVWFEGTAPAEAVGPQVGDLVTVFEHALGLMDVVVQSIVPREGLKAVITCVPYAAALQAAAGVIPAHHTGAGRPPTLNSAIIARSSGDRDRAMLVINAGLEAAGLSIESAIGDEVLTPGEKVVVVSLIQGQIDARADLTARVTALGLGAHATWTAWDAANAALDAVLATMTTPVAWDDRSDVTSGFDAAALSAAWKAVVQTDQDLRSLIAAYVPPGSIGGDQVDPSGQVLIGSGGVGLRLGGDGLLNVGVGAASDSGLSVLADGSIRLDDAVIRAGGVEMINASGLTAAALQQVLAVQRAAPPMTRERVGRVAHAATSGTIAVWLEARLAADSDVAVSLSFPLRGAAAAVSDFPATLDLEIWEDYSDDDGATWAGFAALTGGDVSLTRIATGTPVAGEYLVSAGSYSTYDAPGEPLLVVGYYGPSAPAVAEIAVAATAKPRGLYRYAVVGSTAAAWADAASVVTLLDTDDKASFIVGDVSAGASTNWANPVGHHSRLVIESPGAATLSVTADAIAMSTVDGAHRNLRLTAALTLDCSGTGLGGLDTGTLAADTSYALWVAGNGVAGADDLIASLSDTAPAIPSGFSYAALIGHFCTDGSGDIRPFRKAGRVFEYIPDATNGHPEVATTASTSPIGDVNTGDLDAVAYAPLIPASAVRALLLARRGNNVLVASNRDTHGDFAGANPPLYVFQAGGAVTAQPVEFAVLGSNFYWACSAGTTLAGRGWIRVQGYEDGV